MMRKWLSRGLPILALALMSPVRPAFAGVVDAQDVQSQNANPSPADSLTGSSIGQYGGVIGYAGGVPVNLKARDSQIDNYINQEERVNINVGDGVVKVLRTNQKNEINDYIVKLFPIHNANRREMRDALRAMAAMEGGRSEVIQDKEGDGTQYAEIMVPSYMMPYVEQAISSLDVDWLRSYDDGGMDEYFKPMNRRVEDVDRLADVAGAGDDATNYTVIDKTNNAARRFGEPYRDEAYIKTAKLVDIPTNQVTLEVKIYEVSVSNDTKLGLDYINWKNGPGSQLFSFLETGSDAHARAQGGYSIFDPFAPEGSPGNPNGEQTNILREAYSASYRAVNYLLPSSYVDFLQAKGKARVINTATLKLTSSHSGSVVTDNQVVAVVASNGGEGDRSVTHENLGSTGIDLEMTPYVGTESMELDLDLDIGYIDDDYDSADNTIAGVSPGGLPIIGHRTLNTTVRLLDGQPFVIAGMSRMTNVDSTAKVPILGSIPIVGYLFGGETNVRRKNDLIVTITPTFDIANATNTMAASQISVAKSIAKGDGQNQGAPQLKFGFDQWIFGDNI